MRRLIAFILTGVLTSFSATASAQVAPVTSPSPSPVNVAGEQRMLSQRIAKLYSQIGLNVLPSLAIGQMTTAVARFEENLGVLKPAVASSGRTRLAYARLRDEWQGLKMAVSVAVSRDAAEALTRQAELTLLAAEELTRALEDEGTSINGRVVNLAGRQRMLSQRIANNYLLRNWGVEASSVRENLESSVNDFSAGLIKLRAQEGNSAAIQGELEEITQQWEWLQASLQVEGAGTYSLIVSESADAILEATNRVTQLFEQQGRQ